MKRGRASHSREAGGTGIVGQQQQQNGQPPNNKYNGPSSIKWEGEGGGSGEMGQAKVPLLGANLDTFGDGWVASGWHFLPEANLEAKMPSAPQDERSSGVLPVLSRHHPSSEPAANGRGGRPGGVEGRACGRSVGRGDNSSSPQGLHRC